MTKSILFSLGAAFLMATTASAQWTNADGADPFNPNSNQLMTPQIIYDPGSGLVSIGNIGTNGVIDSTDNAQLLGDDVGMISFQITATDPTISTVLPLFEDGIAWSAPVFFNGKMQLSGSAVGAAFLPVSAEPTPVMQLATGLDADNFRDADGNVSISVGTNFNATSPGTTLFTTGDAFETGAFRIVPEPCGLCLAVLAGVAIVGYRRRQ